MKHLQRSDDPPAHSWNAVPLVRDRNGVEWEVGAAQRHPQRVRARLEQAVDHWIERARQMPIITRVKTPIPRPTVVYDLRGSVAGMAVSLREQPGPPQQWMHVHPELLMRYPIQMIQQTTPHEIAHLVVDWYLPRTREHHGAQSTKTLHAGLFRSPEYERLTTIGAELRDLLREGDALRGHVDGDAQMRHRHWPAGDGGDRLAVDMLGQLDEIVGRLGDAEQGAGAERAVNRVAPACERLDARDAPGGDLDLRSRDLAAEKRLAVDFRGEAITGSADHDGLWCGLHIGGGRSWTEHRHPNDNRVAKDLGL